MKIGNWTITENSIDWQGKGPGRFEIPATELLELTDEDDEEAGMYRWIVLATDEDFLTEDDLYDLNFAFVYMAGKRGMNFDYQVFDATVAHQFELLDEEGETQPSLDDVTEEDAAAEQMRKDALTERD